MNSKPSITTICVFIALKEEFRIFKEVFRCDLAKVRNDSTADSIFEGEYELGTCSLRIAVAFAAQMGETNTARLTQVMLHRYSPSVFAVLGIAGALSSDLQLTDVVVANSVESYIDHAKIQTRKSTLLDRLGVLMGKSGGRSQLSNSELSAAGTTYRPTPRIYNAVESLEFANSELLETWKSAGKRDYLEMLSSVSASGQVREVPIFHLGPIASGPFVVAAPDFSQFLRDRNRKVSAIEMESGGALNSIFNQLPSPESLIIRGISDFADDRKSQLDGTSGGVYRQVAMRNATRLFDLILEAGIASDWHRFNDTRADSQPEGRIASTVISRSPESETRVQSVINVITALKSNFDFIWELGSYDGVEPVVFWPVRLRKPTPIHAAQTFAAAALSQKGAKVVLCLDNLGNKDHTEHDFLTAIRRWWSKANGLNDFECKLFSDITTSQAEGTTGDPWLFVDRWLGKTDKMLDAVLRISKTLDAEEIKGISEDMLKRKRPRRLLNPAVVWACLDHIASLHQGKPLITLGGHDERPLWEAWRGSIADGRYGVGHLYLPSLGRPVSPLHMSSISINWTSYEDILTSLRADIQRNGADWFRPFGMVAWTLKQCVNLPDFVATGCSTLSPFNIGSEVDSEEVASQLAHLLDERLLGAN